MAVPSGGEAHEIMIHSFGYYKAAGVKSIKYDPREHGRFVLYLTQMADSGHGLQEAYLDDQEACPDDQEACPDDQEADENDGGSSQSSNRTLVKSERLEALCTNRQWQCQLALFHCSHSETKLCWTYSMVKDRTCIQGRGLSTVARCSKDLIKNMEF
ncbi:hypothetical protein BU15DRAFT_62727 [Melanogaster broomeanus]|nr:hypothetical protein BU15DRAFT_62727 [Melanogaster broomeanus]